MGIFNYEKQPFLGQRMTDPDLCFDRLKKCTT